MGYLLESKNEFKRLEEQSSQSAYDYRSELSGLKLASGMHVLDAGCGSGIVTRYLAEKFPLARASGVDVSPQRIKQAALAARGLNNIEFAAADLASLPFASATFDVIVCRYVFQHLSDAARARAIKEFFRVLKPGGTLLLIDTDGFLVNLFPASELVMAVLEKLRSGAVIDAFAGRKLAPLAARGGFTDPDTRVETICFKNEIRAEELKLMQERFKQTRSYIEKLAGSELQAKRFVKEFLAALADASSTYFVNKFIVTVRKGQI